MACHAVLGLTLRQDVGDPALVIPPHEVHPAQARAVHGAGWQDVVTDDFGVGQRQRTEAGHMLAQSGANRGDGALHEMQLWRGLRHFGQDFFDRHAAAQVDTTTQAVFLNLGIHQGTPHRGDLVQAGG